MAILRSIVCICLIFLLSGLSEGKVVSRVSLDRLHPHWKHVGRAREETPVRFGLALRQQNLEELTDLFWQVSTPSSPKYRKYPSLQEVHDLTAPHEDTINDVRDWLRRDAGLSSSDVLVQSSIARARCNVGQASKLFSADFHTFENKFTGRRITRHLGALSIPDHLDQHIDLVLGLSEFASPSQDDHATVDSVLQQSMDTLLSERVLADNKTGIPKDPYLHSLLTPMFIKEVYSVPNGARSFANNMQSLVTWKHKVHLDSMYEFSANMGYKVAPNVTLKNQEDMKDDKDKSGLADLNVQYMVSIAEGAHTWSYNRKDAFDEHHFWLLEWANDLAADKAGVLPHVHVIPQSRSVAGDCEISDLGCVQYGYQMQDYMNLTDIEFQKLGAAGHSIIVSSGYSGAPGISSKCPSRLRPKVITKCEFVAYTTPGNGDECIWPEPIPLGKNDKCTKLRENDNCKEAHAAFLLTNKGLPCNISLGDHDKLMSECACIDLQARASGDCIVGPSLNTPTRYFLPEYPASSPYVTAVGTTRITKQTSDVCSLGTYPQLECPLGEVAATTEDGALVTSGGGFSLRPMPSQATYQKAHVEKWLRMDKHPPREAFNIKNRGYPDVAANGHNCLYFSPGGKLEVDKKATCATAIFGAIITLVNSKIQREGNGPLGFLNPTLYEMAQVSPQTFNDITRGNNSCTATDCCDYGYTATAGWDPVTGLGTPNYVEFLRFLLPETFSAKKAAPKKKGEGPSYVARADLPKMILPFVAAGVLVNVGLAAFLGLRLHKQLTG